jgi:hypothetical protein
MITGAPLPDWRVLAGLARPAPRPQVLAAPWLRPGDGAQWYSRSSWALAGLAAAWNRRHGRPPSVWLPAYFCDATLDPLRRTTGARIRFVPVDSSLAIDWQAGRLIYPGELPDLVLLPHFFGVPQDAAAAHAFCRETGATLVEDCAHALVPTPDLGAMGDHVLWSPHKLLAVPQGGVLITRPGATLGPDQLAAGGHPAGIAGWLVKRLIQKLAPAAILPPATRSGPQRFEDDPASGAMPDTPMLGDAAARLLAAATPALPKVAAARRSIAQTLLDVLHPLGQWQPLFDPAAHTPYRLVMRCNSPDIAAARFDVFRRQGIPVESWPDMPPEVTADPERFGAALELRRTLLCFPVHQGLDVTELVAAANNARDRR